MLNFLNFSKTKPLIQLQQEKDKSGKRFLTCYLFPQAQINNKIRGKSFRKRCDLTRIS